MKAPEKYYIGDSCLCWSIGNSIKPELSFKIVSVYQQLKKELPFKGVLDFVPSYNALAVHFDPLSCDIKAIEAEIDTAFRNCPGPGKTIHHGKELRIPVVYNGEDLTSVADTHKITVRELINIHKNGQYTVAMVGFKPHFPYLIGLDERLTTPRLKTPRLCVPAGSLAIGGAQTGIYPEDSPGGWHIIGTTNPHILKEINPGDSVLFKEVKKL